MTQINHQNTLNIAIRSDASINNGTGHVMRCLTLAKRLKEMGCRVNFICRSTEGNLIDFLQIQEFPVVKLPFTSDLPLDMSEELQIMPTLLKNIDLLILDNYLFDERYERTILAQVNTKILVIDDLADRKHYCHFLLDQNAYINFETRYENLILRDNCKLLLGPQYALLREEFKTLRSQVSIRNHPVKRLLILFGGSDPTNETSKALSAAMSFFNESIIIDVVVGGTNPFYQSIEQECLQYQNVNYYHHTDQVAKLMLKADLAIGAGGSTSWERCCLGLPSIVLALAENQVAITRSLGAFGAALPIENNYIFTTNDYLQSLRKIASMDLAYMSRSSYDLIDGLGADRAGEEILR